MSTRILLSALAVLALSVGNAQETAPAAQPAAVQPAKPQTGGSEPPFGDEQQFKEDDIPF